MRLEITYSHPMVIAAWYATDGRLLARGYGLDEESARQDAERDAVANDILTYMQKVRGFSTPPTVAKDDKGK